jgi:predicted HD phosphohydrolase
MELSEGDSAHNMTRAAATVAEIISACDSMKGLPYDGEPVDQLEHALQSAQIARSEGGGAELVVACLLHDIARAPAAGGMPFDDPAEHHGAAGARWLTPRVGARVASLVERHVPAKRYLVATDREYRVQLTEVSERTLRAQGGPMNAEEIAAFRSNPDWGLAVALRRIDDRAKVVGLEVPPVESYEEVLLEVVTAALGERA